MSLDGRAAFALVLALLEDGEARLATRLRDPADAADFLAFLRRHALAGFVYAQAEQSGVADCLPSELRPTLRDAYLEQWTRCESLLTRMTEVGKLLAAAGIDHLFLKGPLFAHRYYGNVDRRLTGDVDLLVREADVDAVDSLLGSAGFAKKSRPLISRRLAMRFTHHFEYQRRETVVELHWDFARHFTYHVDEERLWAGRRWLEYRGQRYPIPSSEHDLLVQLLTIFKDTELGTIAARSFIDLQQILRALEPRFDWAAFLAARAREGMLAISVNMLDLGLEVMAARAEFPALAAELDRHEPLLIGRGRALKGLELFDATPPALGNKRRLFQLYEGSLAAAYGWWILSLPWRLAVYR